ncbi:MAG: hypothetical protein IJJ44_03305 [Solobacterium sp.]|nr:hypothetical protein [Solobacterium sp.]
MNDAIIVALITAGATLIGVIFSNRSMQQGIIAEMEKRLAVHEASTKIRIEELTREVREHNEFAKRIPVLEEQIKVANHRIEDLERGR